MSTTSILELKDLQKTFSSDIFKKKQTAVDGISLVFPEGQCTGLMGHNGAGKTTTIRMIFGLIKPDRGQIFFRGQPIQRQHKKLIGYMPETNKLAYNLNSEEILRFHLRAYLSSQLSKKSFNMLIEEKLKETGLWDHRHKKVKELSKGMGRRLAWAQATIHNPDLIVLDEPFSGLDPLGRQLMGSLINKLRQKQKSIILCTHELWSVNEVCDGLHILQKGHLVYSSLNPKESRKSTISINYQLTLAGCSAIDLSNLKNRHKLADWTFKEENGYHQKLWLADYLAASAWLNACAKEGIIITDFRKSKGFEEASLIDYFKGDQSA